MARIQGAVARKESDDKSRRLQRKHEEIAQAGRPSGGGTRPYGYESDHRTVRPAEAAVIRKCAAKVLAGDSLRSICVELNADGVPTVSGKPWSTQTLAAVADVGPDQRPARAQGRRSSPRPSGRRSSPRPRRSGSGPSLRDPERRTNRSARRYLLPRLLALRPVRRAAVLASARRWQPPLRLCEWPELRWLRHSDRRGRPARGRSLSRRCLHRLDSPELAATLAGRAEDEDAAAWQAEIEQTAGPAATSWPGCGARRRSPSPSGFPHARRSSSARRSPSGGWRR